MLPSEAYSQNNEDLVIKVLRELITGKGINIETFGKQPTSAEAEALRLLNYNTGKFAQNYVKEQKNLDPRIVKAMGVQKEKKEETDMPQMQEGGMLGDLPPEAIANGNVIQGAPVGEVAVPGGGGPTDDGVPTSLPEGTFVLNAASVEYHGTKHINDLIKKSIRNLVKKGVQISGEDLNPDDDVPVAISNGEYIIPPEVSRDIGIKKLEDMNERGLEYRKRIEEQEKQKMAAQDQAMQSFMGAPIQSEQQMPMQEGGEASPPDEAMPQVPKTPEDTSTGGGGRGATSPFVDYGLTEGQKAVIEAELLKRRLQQEFFNRESERQRRMMEQEERDKGMIFNERTGEFDLMAQADKPVVPATPAGPNIMTGPRKQDYMDKLIQQSMKARGMAQVGGAIERDPQSTFLVPQIVRQAQGLPQGANTFPTSPQEPFIGGIPTGSVLENISNAMPQSLQPTSFMQPMDQKKSPEIARFSFADGGEAALKTRGFRNNNPMNLVANDKTRIFHGVVGVDDKKNPTVEKEQEYLIFDTMENGLRAGIYNLRRKYNNMSVKDIVSKYSETDQDTYTTLLVSALNKVEGMKGKFDSSSKLDLNNPNILNTIILGIIQKETSGSKFFTPDMIKKQVERSTKEKPNADPTKQYFLSKRQEQNR